MKTIKFIIMLLLGISIMFASCKKEDVNPPVDVVDPNLRTMRVETSCDSGTVIYYFTLIRDGVKIYDKIPILANTTDLLLRYNTKVYKGDRIYFEGIGYFQESYCVVKLGYDVWPNDDDKFDIILHTEAIYNVDTENWTGYYIL